MYKAKDVSNVFVFGFRTQVGACRSILCGVCSDTAFASSSLGINTALGRCMQLMRK